MIIVEKALNSKTIATDPLHYAANLANALDPKFTILPDRRWQVDQDMYRASDRRAFAANNKYSIQRNIFRKTASCLLFAVIPLKNDRQAQPVTDGPPSQRNTRREWIRSHVKQP
jgi:hypothetical protein